MLEVMMKLKNVKNMDSRRSAQIDWAYTEVKQPGKANQQRKQRPPMQEYIRHLIFTRLSKATAPDVAKKLVRVPWAESEKYVLKVRYFHTFFIPYIMFSPSLTFFHPPSSLIKVPPQGREDEVHEYPPRFVPRGGSSCH